MKQHLTATLSLLFMMVCTGWASAQQTGHSLTVTGEGVMSRVQDTVVTITGTVVDAGDQSAIGGATVSLSPSGKSTYTDDNGYFQFLDLEAPQQYTIQVQKSDYKTYRKTISADVGQTENITIPLEKKQ